MTPCVVCFSFCFLLYCLSIVLGLSPSFACRLVLQRTDDRPFLCLSQLHRCSFILCFPARVHITTCSGGVFGFTFPNPDALSPRLTYVKARAALIFILDLLFSSFHLNHATQFPPHPFGSWLELLLHLHCCMYLIVIWVYYIPLFVFLCEPSYTHKAHSEYST